MKSLPEKEIFNQLESRLRNYTEMPDEDTWDKIAGAIPREKGISGWVWFDRFSAIAIIGLLLLLVIMNQSGITNNSNSNNIVSRDESLSINKNNSNSGSNNNLVDKDSSLNRENNGAPKDGLADDDRTTNKTVAVNEKIFSENEESVLSGSNNKDSTNSSYNEVNPSSADNNKGTNHREDIDNVKPLGLNNNDIDVAVISMSNSISVTKSDPSGALSNTSLTDQESNNVQSKSNISNTYSPSDLKTPIDSIDKLLMKTEDSLEVDRKKRVPKELRKEKKIFKSILYFTATPTLAYYKLTPDMHDNVTVVGLKQAGIFNTNRLGFNLEAGYQRKLNEKLEVYGGLSYYQQSQQITYYYESAEGYKINTAASNGLTFTVDPVAQKREKRIDYAMKNIGVSAGLFYLIKDGRLQHKIGGGLQYQKGLARQNADATYSNASSSYFNYLIAYRLEWRYRARTNFFIQPNVNHVIQSKENLTAPFSVKPYRAGIGFGILYWF